MLSALAFLHQRLGVAMIAYGLLLALWGTVSYVRSRQISPSFRSAFLLLIGLTAVQGLLGLAAIAAQGRPREWLHLVYGAFAILFLPAIVVYAGQKPDDRAREAAFLTVACWVVLIAFGRGFMTGG